MRGYERQALLDRIDRETATVGATIPERLELAGEPIAVRDRVFELQSSGVSTSADRAAVDELRRKLRRARRERVDRLESAAIDRETGEAVVDTVKGIDRALAILDNLGADEDIEARMQDRERADQERWLNFLKQALGRSDDGPAQRGGR